MEESASSPGGGNEYGEHVDSSKRRHYLSRDFLLLAETKKLLAYFRGDRKGWKPKDSGDDDYRVRFDSVDFFNALEAWMERAMMMDADDDGITAANKAHELLDAIYANE